MASPGQGAVLRSFQTLFGGGTVAGLTDAELLARVELSQQGVAEAALEALVRRHGPMVLSVCRKVLRDPHNADDAFQASFLVLCRNARSIRDPCALGAWLHGVAYRVSLRAKVQETRRRLSHGGDLERVAQPQSDGLSSDQVALLHEEVNRLPQKYRAPVVLCYLEGHTGDEAARQLGWPVGTVNGRLARARSLLRTRLERRGLAPSAAFALGGSQAPGALSDGLVTQTVQGVLTAVGPGAPLVTATAAALAEGVIQAMLIGRAKWLAAFVVSGATVAVGAGMMAYGALGDGQGAPGKQGPPAAAAPDETPTKSSALVDLARDELEALDAQLEARKAAVQKAEAQRQLAAAILARSLRLNQKNANFVSPEEVAKNEAEVKVAEALCNEARAGVREVEVRIDQTKRLLSQPEQIAYWLEHIGRSSSAASLERRLGTVERKLDLILQRLDRLPAVPEHKGPAGPALK
jgi:RNA polymerase sigma factor (sigma-70 family)